ncbi:MAG: AbrB/MazE/SpoVT family DNA-binding domain-containing protein [Candidatus Omnitrophica bacterium]|nr:AbrB/MazE/SpoVT family DNA-binding domain-containing protein [Candidatus Omnitrophota bacterium]MBU0896514.1 AbrB/MazE/SpoVT family DNA-binding domain-containing protein [Candidatus Omnitrophota bacterium]MBU1133621.1 AbrB/MazE/SpoVT family DNA-binding domain-containing protein [Candidatus Omnitrophota bacterium]MBU1366396.1 AbrB/MazE/SpoVT family DNA-binding domain-containing protein [Candidatus Omnitrophota bacterium]MBU1524502.1 AbrB/MazE/SpoVT family DNA-binding domain-containing protein
MSTSIKKLFKHGGSYAVDIPMDFVKHAGVTEVILESTSKGIKIRPKTELDNIEAEPLFEKFIQALAVDAMKHPQRLHDVKEVWDKEWDELLKNVEANEE